MLNLKAIYDEARSRDPWEEAPEPEPDASASVLAFDQVVGLAASDLHDALREGNLDVAKAALRGLDAISAAFGGADWVINGRP